MKSSLKWVAAIVACVLTLAARPSQADLASCVNGTGYALSEINSAVVVQNESTAATLGVTCDPPQPVDLARLGSAGGSAIASYLIGFGASIATGSIATPDSNLASAGRVVVQQYFEFTVIPDDPSSSEEVPIRVVARHRFGTIEQSASGRGMAAVTHVGRYEIRRQTYNGVRVGPPWNSEGLPASDEGVFDIVQDVDVPPHFPLFFLAYLEQQCWSWGGGGSFPGSAGCTAESEVTYEIATDAAATIVFGLEEGLGLDPPQLDVVTVPEPAAALWIALATLFVLRAASRRGRER